MLLRYHKIRNIWSLSYCLAYNFRIWVIFKAIAFFHATKLTDGRQSLDGFRNGTVTQNPRQERGAETYRPTLVLPPLTPKCWDNECSNPVPPESRERPKFKPSSDLIRERPKFKLSSDLISHVSVMKPIKTSRGQGLESFQTAEGHSLRCQMWCRWKRFRSSEPLLPSHALCISSSESFITRSITNR